MLQLQVLTLSSLHRLTVQMNSTQLGLNGELSGETFILFKKQTIRKLEDAWSLIGSIHLLELPFSGGIGETNLSTPKMIWMCYGMSGQSSSSANTCRVHDLVCFCELGVFYMYVVVLCF